jgi:hypothetical protein
MTRKQTILSLLLMTLVFVAMASPADASRKWCHRDPVFLIAGTKVSVDVAIYEDLQSQVTGPIAVTLYVPKGISAKLVSTDSGFNNRGETVSIVVDNRLQATSRSVQIRASVSVPAKSRIDALLTILPKVGAADITKTGTTNASISASAKVTPSK